MGSTQIFWMQLLTSVFVFGIVAVWYVWPYLTRLSRNSALIPLLFVQVPRYVGMTLLVAGMVDPNLPLGFRSSAAYGDLLEAALALVSIFALRRNWLIAVPLVWVANTWGFVDLLARTWMGASQGWKRLLAHRCIATSCGSADGSTSQS